MISKLAKHPINMIVIINTLAFLLLFFYRTPPNYQILFVGVSITILSVITYLAISFFNLGDRYLFIIASMLISIGVVMLCRLDYSMELRR